VSGLKTASWLELKAVTQANGVGGRHSSLLKNTRKLEGDSGEDYIMHITHNRHGGTFSIPLRFIKHQARFEQKIVEQ
jgi:hypothetical protein